jgi:adenosine deaminase
MTPDTHGRSLRRLPKAHLHVHLEGAMRPETARELAERAGRTLPIRRRYSSFSTFIDAYRALVGLLRGPDDVHRLVNEVVEDAAADGAAWIEPTVLPAACRDVVGTDAAVLDLVLDAGFAAARTVGIGFGVLVVADRTAPASDAEAVARLAAERAGRGVVAFGLVGDERGHPATPFRRAFAIAREAGLISAPHAGELAGPASVIAAIEKLGARRIQHGVRSIDDPALVERLASAGICLDVCPTSNEALGITPDIRRHPLPRLVECGIACSINADDPLLFGSSLLNEYERCRHELLLDDHSLASIARASLLHSGAPADLIHEATRSIDAWLGASTDEATRDPTATHANRDRLRKV